METDVKYSHPVKLKDPVAIVSISGSIDGSSSMLLEQVLNAQVNDGHAMIVADVGNVHYISSSALRAFMGSMRKCRAKDGDLRIAAVQPNVSEVLEVSGLTGMFSFFDTVDDAVKSFSKEASA